MERHKEMSRMVSASHIEKDISIKSKENTTSPFTIDDLRMQKINTTPGKGGTETDHSYDSIVVELPRKKKPYYKKKD